MRNNQVEIKVTRFNDEIPKTICIFPGEDIRAYTMSTYTDSNNVFEALAAAYLNILKAIKEDEDFPKFGDSGKVRRDFKAYKNNNSIIYPDYFIPLGKESD